MKFWMHSSYGEGASLLHDIELEGNEVALFINDDYYKRVWDGLINKVDAFEPPEDAVVIFDFSGFGKLADELRASGRAVIGASEFCDKLEQDRMLGLNFMEECGIKVPFTASFEGFDVKEIEEFIDEHDDVERWAFKPDGKAIPNSLTYCSRDREDLLKWVSYVEENYGKEIDSFVLQEFVEGVCVSSEAWCDGKRFVRPFNHTVETKGFMNDNLGQSTGCSGNLVWPEHDESCRIIREGIAKAERLVVEAGYVGPIDLNAVVNEEGVWGLEWTPRMGYSSMPTLIKMVEGGVGKMFSDIARGQGGTMRLVDKFAASVKLTIPPYPIEPDKAEDVQKVSPNIGIPIRGIPDDKKKCCYFYEVEADHDDKEAMVHSVGSGVVADIIGLGEDCIEAFDEPYEILEEVILPNMQYRTDLSECLGRMYEEVEEQEGGAIGMGMGMGMEMDSEMIN